MFEFVSIWPYVRTFLLLVLCWYLAGGSIHHNVDFGHMSEPGKTGGRAQQCQFEQASELERWRLEEMSLEQQQQQSTQQQRLTQQPDAAASCQHGRCQQWLVATTASCQGLLWLVWLGCSGFLLCIVVAAPVVAAGWRMWQQTQVAGCQVVAPVSGCLRLLGCWLMPVLVAACCLTVG
jgi:hypothetical protein